MTFCQTAFMFIARLRRSVSWLLPYHGSRYFAVFLLIGLTGCAGALKWEEPTAGSSPPPGVRLPANQGSAVTGRQAAAAARSQIGIPYRYGGSSPSGFDCSGLVQYSYKSAGLSVPRTSGELYRKARRIDLIDAEPGDLLFFRYGRTVSHVAIYLGDMRFVHAPSSGREVSVASLQTPHYREHFVQAGRIY